MKKTILVIILILNINSSAFTLGKLGEFEFKKSHNNLYIMHGPLENPNIKNEGFMNNPALIESKHGLIVIDPGGNYNVGKKILKEIEKISKKQIIASINTHKHGDHWFANKALLEKYPKMKIYAHRNMIRDSKNGSADKWYDILNKLSNNLKGTKPFPFPNEELKDGQVLNIDGEEFRILHPMKAHTNTDIVITHINSKTIFLGDNLMKGRFGGFRKSSSMIGNILLLEKIKQQQELRLYVPGHGQSGKMNDTINPFLNYLKIVVDESKKAYDDDIETYEIKPKVIKLLEDYKQWDAFNNQLGKHLLKAYDEHRINDMQ
jgi:glyoxylase-like metal-dependent hydrolase (beta-lactamase superfamily II)